MEEESSVNALREQEIRFEAWINKEPCFNKNQLEDQKNDRNRRSTEQG